MRVTLPQAAQLLGKNQTQILQALAQDCKFFDKNFPKYINGFFQLSDLLAWRKEKDGTAAVKLPGPGGA